MPSYGSPSFRGNAGGKSKKKAKKVDPLLTKFRQCPACGGPIDYLNSCRRCGRGWTPELSETEKLEQAEQNPADDQEEEPKLIGAREAAGELIRTPAEIDGKNAKVVGTKKKAATKYKHWQIQPDDNETEITRKRSLMRLDSRKVYNAMGLVVRAHERQRDVLLWLSRLWEFLDEKERTEFAPTADMLKKAMENLTKLRKEFVDRAVEMEKKVAKEHTAARSARFAKANKGKRGKLGSNTHVTDPGVDTEGFETVPLIKLAPEDLMEQVKERLALRSPKVSKNQALDDVEDEEN